MKTTIRKLKLLLLLGASLATTAAFGQATSIWGGTNGITGIDIGQATNWNPLLPNTANSDIAEWNGTVPGPLNLNYDTITMASGFGSSGITLYMNSAQTSPLTIGTSLTTTPTIAILNITLDAGAGAFTLGGTDTSHRINIIGRPSGAIHSLINNSANTATLTPWIRWTAGGGTAYELDFSGTGNWEADSFLENDNGSGGTIIVVDGPGTMIWNPTGVLGSDGINSPISINAGAMILQGSHPRLGNQAINLTGNFTFAPTNTSAAQTLSGTISGTGTNTITAGTLTLSNPNSTYSGDTVLKGGELKVNGAENPGVSGPLGLGTIRFNGGTLGFGVNNVFDYSARFSTDPGQIYNIDTAGQNVAFTNATGLTGVGNTLTKFGAGTLTLAGPSTYTGLTTVSAGKLVFLGSKAGLANITVNDGAALGASGGSQLTPATLTVGTVSGATLEFNNVSSTSIPLIAAGTVSAAGTITVNVNSGALTPGQNYPLFSWTSGSAPAVNLAILNGFIGFLSTNGNTIQLNVTATAFKWTGLNNGSWDLTTGNNWVQNGGPVIFANGGPALFDDTSITTNITITGVVQPKSVTFNNETEAYTVTNSVGNDLGGAGSLSKFGNGSLTLTGGANTYTGITTIGDGILSVGVLANGGLASDLGAANNSATNLIIDGGELQYTGAAASSDRSFSVGLSGATVDASDTDTLVLNAPALGYTGNGPRTLTLSGTGTSNVLAAAYADNGGASSLLKNGPGVWVVTANNTFSGLTTINNGVLQVGAGAGTGSLGTGSVLNNRGLDFNRTGTVTISGPVSGTGAVTNDGTGTVVLAGNNTYTGGTYINAGSLQIGNGGGTGSIDGTSPLVDNGTLIFNTTQGIVRKLFGSQITGTGNVWVRSTGVIEMSGPNTYTGWTLIDSGATFQPSDGNSGALVSSVVTNNGTLLLTRQDANVFGYTNNIVGAGRVVKDNNNQNIGDITLLGANTYTNGTWIRGGGVILGDAVTPGAGTIIGNVIFTNAGSSFITPRTLTLNHPEDFTFTNNIITTTFTDGSVGGQRGALVIGLTGSTATNMVTLTGNNTYVDGTTINGGTLQVGNGGATGSIGTGGVVDNTALIFNRSGNLTVSGNISGAGNVTQIGSGTVTLSASNTVTGFTTISNGTLVVSSAVGGPLNIEGGTLAAGGLNVVGSMFVGGTLSLDGGTMAVTLNKSLAVSNTVITANGGFNYTAGTLKIVNGGPTLHVGDTFQFFPGPVTGGAGIPIVSPGFTVANNLAVDGSVTVTAIAQPPAPTISKVSLQGGTNIVITATNNFGPGGSWSLLATNTISAPLSTWPVVTNGFFGSTGSIVLTNAVGTNQQFYILRAP